MKVFKNFFRFLIFVVQFEMKNNSTAYSQIIIREVDHTRIIK